MEGRPWDRVTGRYERLGDKSCIQMYNVMFRRIILELKMLQTNKNFYDPRLGNMVPKHKLEIWPGYVTDVQKFEGGVMLRLDVSHKVLRTPTAYEVLKDVHKQDKDNLQSNAMKALLGVAVLTRYNNKTYRVDYIDWNMSPSFTFVDHNGEEVSFLVHYKRHYGLDIWRNGYRWS